MRHRLPGKKRCILVMTTYLLYTLEYKVVDMSETDGIGKPADGGMRHQKAFILTHTSYDTMRRLTAALALLLLVGTLWQPCVEASGAPAENAPIALFGPRSDYHTYASMVTELQGLVSAHPDLVKMESIGKTYEGRDIWAVKVSDEVSTNDSSEPDVLIFGGIHAREVMGPEVAMHVLNYLLDGYGKNETLTKFVNTKETWFVPMINPDGHVYVEGGNDWRKNRRPTTGGNIGVDLNRNWGYMFGVDASTSADPASEVYHGPYPFSENETIALRDLALRQQFATSLSFHSYGELILYPWGYTSTHAPDYNELSSMAATMAAWNGYTDEQSCTLYPTHGDSDDWLYANVSALPFTIELDTDFYPPASQIDITCQIGRAHV
jgi:carboxypeptidase T